MSGEDDLGIIVNDMKQRFVAQYKFARQLKRQFKSDYACLDYGILLEYDGLQTYRQPNNSIYEEDDERQDDINKSGHQTLKGVMNDQEKHNMSTVLGFYTLRYNRDTLFEDKVIEDVTALVIRRKEDVKHYQHCTRCGKRIWLPLSMVIDMGSNVYSCLLCQWEIDEAEDNIKRSKRRNKVNAVKYIT
jgi:very-short-patch-repair endonuclease